MGRRRREKAGPGVKLGPGLSGPGAGRARGSEWGRKWGPGAGRARGSEWGRKWGPGAGRSRGVARAGKSGSK